MDELRTTERVIPEPLLKTLSKGQIEQERVFYSTSKAVHSNNLTQVTQAISNLDTLSKKRDQWSPYLRNGFGHLRDLLQAKKSILDRSNDFKNSRTKQCKQESTQLSKEIRKSQDRLKRWRYNNPVKPLNFNHENVQSSLPSSIHESGQQIMKFSEKLNLIKPSEKQRQMIQKHVKETLIKIGKLTQAPKKLVNTDKWKSNLKRIIQSLVVLEKFYSKCFSNQAKNLNLMYKLRKELLGLYFCQDFLKNNLENTLNQWHTTLNNRASSCLYYQPQAQNISILKTREKPSPPLKYGETLRQIEKQISQITSIFEELLERSFAKLKKSQPNQEKLKSKHKKQVSLTFYWNDSVLNKPKSKPHINDTVRKPLKQEPIFSPKLLNTMTSPLRPHDISRVNKGRSSAYWTKVLKPFDTEKNFASANVSRIISEQSVINN